MSIGPFQLVLIVLVVLLLFGAGKIPRLMGDLAKGVNAFKKGMKEGEEDTPPKRLESRDDESSKR